MQTPSIDITYYFLTFIDDYTRNSWVYFLRHENEVLDYFRQFEALVSKVGITSKD